MKLELEESRRLTGPNLLWDHPGAILDVWISGVDKQSVVDAWRRHVEQICANLGWQEATTYRLFKDGCSLALSAPMDALYGACEIAEYAWQLTVAEFTEESAPDELQALATIREELSNERNPELIALLEEAKKRNVACISDDDYCSLGMGNTAKTWNVRELPALGDIDWQDYKKIPLAFITGTNGKSTSVRLASEIAKAAQLSAGVTSTDFIRVGDDIIDTGDYSGPGGARILVRDTRTEIAFLEVARGGILRRGLPVEQVNAALITNIAEDHLGQYGIDTVEELAQAKFVVAKGVSKTGVIVLNADNDHVVREGQKLQIPICWYSENAAHPLIEQQRANHHPAVYVSDGNFVFFDGHQEQVIYPIADAPITFNGTAKHNIQNVLGVIGLCCSLALPIDAIRKGLKRFGTKPEDNPGRGNLYQKNGAQLIVDFAHNEHSMKAVINMAKQIPATQRIVMFSHAGDRSDNEMRHLTKAVSELEADLYIAAEVPNYLRGREPMEVPELSRQFLMDEAVPAQKIVTTKSPESGCKIALREMQDGAVVLLFTLDQREQVQACIEQFA